MRFDKFNILYEYMINGSENIYDQDGFIFADFFKLSGPKNLINYANQHLVNVGTGHTRSVFKLGDKVLKIARNEYGRGKNKSEYKTYNEWPWKDIMAKIYKINETNFSWIISEYAKPITSYQQFNKLAGFDLERVKKEINSKNGQEYLDSLYDPDDSYEHRGNQLAAMIFSLVDEYYDRNDFGDLDKYGISRDRGVILVDYGTLT